jgi:hypothetical protein
LLHLKFVIRKFFGLISIPNYPFFTTPRFRVPSFALKATADRQGSRFRVSRSELRVNPFLNIRASFQKAQSPILSPRYLKFILFLLIPCTLYLIPATLPAADAAQVTLGWDSNSEPDLEGYVIYRNTGSPGPPYDYTDTLPEDDLTDPLHPKVTLTGLKKGQEYYIALTAYNTEGVESSFSNDVCVEVADGSVGVCANSSNLVSSDNNNNSNSSNGGDGGFGRWDVGGCFISTAGYDSSTFSKFVAKPVIRSQGLALVFLPLVFIAAVKFGFNRTKGK